MMRFVTLLLLAAALMGERAEALYTSSGPVKVLTKANFGPEVLGSDTPYIVEFYAPVCADEGGRREAFFALSAACSVLCVPAATPPSTRGVGVWLRARDACSLTRHATLSGAATASSLPPRTLPLRPKWRAWWAWVPSTATRYAQSISELPERHSTRNLGTRAVWGVRHQRLSHVEGVPG